MNRTHRQTDDHDADYVPTIREIRVAFDDEIAPLSGRPSDVYEDDRRLFARAVLPPMADVRLGDGLQAGVALRAVGPTVLVHPYTFRQVCSNGAIAARALATRYVARPRALSVSAPAFQVEAALAEIREAVRGCAEPEVFRAVVAEMRTAAEIEADITIQLMPALRRLSPPLAARVQPRIVRQFRVGQDRTIFGLLNAVTRVAREERDPQDRWDIEELGGSMPARVGPPPTAAPPALVLAGR